MSVAVPCVNWPGTPPFHDIWPLLDTCTLLLSTSEVPPSIRVSTSRAPGLQPDPETNMSCPIVAGLGVTASVPISAGEGLGELLGVGEGDARIGEGVGESAGEGEGEAVTLPGAGPGVGL
jgi:hypothetical protein